MKKICLILLILSVAVSSAFARGSADSSGDMTELHIMSRNIGNATTTDNIIHRELERRTGLRLSFDFRSSTNYNQACMTVIASGDYPDAMEFWGTWPRDLQDMADDGILRPLDDLIARYGPEFTPAVRLAEDWFVSTTDGRRYGIPCRTQEFGLLQTMVIRSDWLNRLGLQMPRNSDEFFNVLTAFQQNAEALVGQNRRFVPLGLYSDRLPFLLNYFMSENGMINGWNWVDGRLVHHVNMPGYKNVLQTARRFYQAGLIEPEFLIIRSRDDAMNRIMANQYGTWSWFADSVDEETSPLATQLYAGLPELRGNMGLVPFFQDQNGEFRFTQGFNRQQMIIFTNTPEEKAANIVRLMNFIVSEEGFYLTELGIENEHWHRDSSGRVIARNLSAEEQANLGFWNYAWLAKRSYIPIAASDYVRNFLLNELSSAHAIVSPVSYGPAQARHGSALSQVLNQDLLELITQSDVNFDVRFNELVATWNTSGGAEITREMNETYGGRP